MFSADKQVQDPYREETVYDRRKIAYKDKNYPDTPKIRELIGAGSDYYAFYKFVGIPSIDMMYAQTDLVSEICLFMSFFAIFITPSLYI